MRKVTRWGQPSPEEREALRVLRERNHYVLVLVPMEKTIVDDIFARTNWYAERLAGYETSDAEVAHDVLPILQEWFPRIADMSNLRGAIYHRFATPHASPYVDTLIQWYLKEEEYVNQTLLVQALAAAARAQHAERLWRLCREHPPRSFQVFLMVRLSRFPAVEHEIKDALVKILYGDPMPRLGDLQEISSIRDRRIRDWFKEKAGAPDVALRSIARRCVERGASLPSGVAYSPVSPNRLHQIRSWEVDLAEVTASLMDAAREFHLKIPPTIRGGGFLETADLDRWMVTRLRAGKESVSLWLRLEDLGTVEIVLSREPIPCLEN